MTQAAETKMDQSQSHQETSATQSQAPSEGSPGKILEAVKNAAEPVFAGKFKNTDELLKGYENSTREYMALRGEYDTMKKQMDDIGKVPDAYTLPETIQLGEGEANYLKALAKKSGLTQDQFNKTASEFHASMQSHQENFENRKKEIGDKNLILLEDYVKLVHPGDENLQGIVLSALINDESSRTKAMLHRDKLLNSEVPGMDKPVIQGNTNYDGKKDYDKVYKEHMADPSDPKKKEKFLEMSRDIGHARFGDQIKQVRS